VAEWNLEGRVTFVEGPVANVQDYMRAADVLVLPSRREGLPISVLEGMAAGLPVAASNIPEIADSQVEDGVQGLLFPVGAVGAMGDSLRWLVAEPALRQRMGRAARRRAVDRFSIDLVDERYERLYQGLVGGVRRGPG
jgi:glycosyltransferase involved in cell wall biosynthesis